MNTPTPTIILVEPEQPRNIGSVLRCSANFGLSSIRIVRSIPLSPDHHKEIAVSSAGAHALVELQPFSNLPDALTDSDFVIGTSGRNRTATIPSADRLAQFNLAARPRLTILFGRESQGLSAAELHHCHALLSLPVSSRFPSLNLSHAVALTLFDFFHGTAHTNDATQSHHSSPAIAPRDLQERWLADLSPQHPEATAQLRRLLQRAQPTPEDMALLFNLVRNLRRTPHDQK